MIPIHRALLSVSDKSGLIEFARFLQGIKVELISTGGTAIHLRAAGIPVLDISDYTGCPEILDGRVKTLHPKIHGGLLGIRTNPSHQAQMQSQGIGPIDLVVVNLYPFREAAARAESTFDEVVEQIDIGGPSMVRSAAKNHAFVAVVTDPRDYAWIRMEMENSSGALSHATRFNLAQRAFASTASYDAAIASYLADRVYSPDGVQIKTDADLPDFQVISLQKIQALRYGENPHQRAALYRPVGQPPRGVAGAERLHGKELSYNNLLDSDAAWSLVIEFDRAAAAVIKHTNPSGVAQGNTIRETYILARDCDPVSSFGSVVALNRAIDADTALELNATFVEVILAPDYDTAAMEILQQKKNVRLLRMRDDDSSPTMQRQISGGFLVQDRDTYSIGPQDLRVVTKRAPTTAETEALLFGWRVVKHVKSNAIVFSNAERTLGIGAGQMSRVDSVRWGALRATLPLDGCALASDAFFPFADGLIEAAAHGVRAVIQPGGSVRDVEVIEAADERGIAMVFTGIRHFKH